jgi:hypothetical protein
MKRNPARAACIKVSLASVPGVRSVEANTLTGSVLIHYDPRTVCGSRLLECIGREPPAGAGIAMRLERVRPFQPTSNAASRFILKAVAPALAEAVIQRSVMALAAAIL